MWVCRQHGTWFAKLGLVSRVRFRSLPTFCYWSWSHHTYCTSPIFLDIFYCCGCFDVLAIHPRDWAHISSLVDAVPRALYKLIQNRSVAAAVPILSSLVVMWTLLSITVKYCCWDLIAVFYVLVLMICITTYKFTCSFINILLQLVQMFICIISFCIHAISDVVCLKNS